MSRRPHRRLTAWLAAAATALGLLVAAPAAQAVDGGTGGPYLASAGPPSPTLSVSPRCTSGLDAVTLDAAADNVPGNNNVGFTLDDADDVFLLLTTSDSAGRVRATLPVPAVAAGLHNIRLWSIPSFEGSPSQLANTTYQVPCPSVTVAPAHLARGEGPLTLRLTADGYPNFGDGVHVVFRLDGQQVADRSPSDPGPTRAVTTLAAVPDCGSHEISTDYAQPPDAPEGIVTKASTTLVVTCPTLTSTPASLPQSSLPSNVQLTGDGWNEGGDVTLSIDGAPVATATTDGAGRFAAAVPLAARPCGSVPIVAVQTPRQVPPGAAAAPSVPVPTATTTVQVTCLTTPPADPAPPTAPTPPSAPTGPTPPTKPAPTLVADPVVSSGGVAMASGHGFTPGATVRLAWVLPDASIAPGGITTVVAADGSITVSCLVLPHALLGPRSLRAEQDASVASAPVLVVNGPMEPGRDRLLGRR
jgi:hypothetical protein